MEIGEANIRDPYSDVEFKQQTLNILLKGFEIANYIFRI